MSMSFDCCNQQAVHDRRKSLRRMRPGCGRWTSFPKEAAAFRSRWVANTGHQPTSRDGPNRHTKTGGSRQSVESSSRKKELLVKIRVRLRLMGEHEDLVPSLMERISRWQESLPQSQAHLVSWRSWSIDLLCLQDSSNSISPLNDQSQSHPPHSFVFAKVLAAALFGPHESSLPLLHRET